MSNLHNLIQTVSNVFQKHFGKTLSVNIPTIMTVLCFRVPLIIKP